MKFIVQEIQKNANGEISLSPTIQKDTREEAESAYYGILMYAAISQLPCHAACIYTEDGTPIINKAYYHVVEPEPEPTPEPEPEPEPNTEGE